jgi:hypothetical protein
MAKQSLKRHHERSSGHHSLGDEDLLLHKRLLRGATGGIGGGWTCSCLSASCVSGLDAFGGASCHFSSSTIFWLLLTAKNITKRPWPAELLNHYRRRGKDSVTPVSIIRVGQPGVCSVGGILAPVG